MKLIATNFVDLSGKWRIIKDMDSLLSINEVELNFMNLNFDGEISAPSNWQLQGLNNFSGTIWYFYEFSLDFSPGEDSIPLLEFSGVDYFSEVWLNSKFLGSHEGYFQKFNFKLKSTWLNRVNVLIVRVTSPREIPGTVWPMNKQLIKGIFNHHDCRPGSGDLERGQDGNTGGIWNKVLLTFHKQIILKGVKFSSKLYNDYNSARVLLELSFFSEKTGESVEEINITLHSPDNSEKVVSSIIKIPSGDSARDLVLEIDSPVLWNTWDLGYPALYNLKIESVSFIGISLTTGIREIRLEHDSVFYLNGKRLFLRGTNIIPEQYLSSLSLERIETQVNLLRDANINIIRMHAHVNRDEYYAECDRRGILVWQDFALQWTYDNSDEFNSNAVSQIKDMAVQLYNHPSIAIWCCHNEPGEQINTLDPFLYDAVKSVDQTRPVRLASNYEEHPYDGWYWGTVEGFAATPMGPLVTEFGAQALPELKSLQRFLSSDDISQPDWKSWKFHNFQYAQTFQIAEISKGESIEDFIGNSQEYQSELLSRAINFYRREKFSKITGIFQFMFIDCWPSITWSVVDYYGNLKKGYFTLKSLFNPTLLSIELRQRRYFPGDKLNIEYWLINDLHSELKDCILTWKLDNTTISEEKNIRLLPDSVEKKSFENLNIKLPENSSEGNYIFEGIIYDSGGNILSSQNFSITIEKGIDRNEQKQI